MISPLLDIENLTIQYRTRDGMLTAVSNASFSIDPNESLGLVGESGCGKSTLAHAVLGGLDENGRVTGGTVRYNGEEIQSMSEREFNRKIRWKEISFIPQTALDGLDPLQRIEDKATEIASVHTDLSKREALDRLQELFSILGLQEERISDYPHELSGGMRQRAMIALALFLRPSLVIADEPTTALDVIMQDQVFRYLEKVREEFDIGLLLITHDISVVFENCDRLAVLHSGQVGEVGPVTDVFDAPLHPYTIQLQEAFPDMRFPEQELNSVEGHPPKTMNEVNACTFADRCPWAVEECRESAPNLRPVSGEEGNDRHLAACFRKDEELRFEIPEFERESSTETNPVSGTE